MALNEDQARAYLESETQWNAEPALSTAQQDDLVNLAETSTGSGEFTYRTLATSVFLGLRRKRVIAVETYKDGEDKIFEHLDRLLKEWEWAAPADMLGLPIPQIFAGGVSRSDIETRQSDTDRPESVFSIGLHSNAS
ncbi:MAG TPA: hypothetical protein VF290_22175 [Pyrinomonadaceae bacterium]